MEIDFESALITKIVDEKDIRSVIKCKITPEFFYSPNSRAAFVYLTNWYTNPAYGDVPSWESFSDTFEHFEPVRMDDSIIALCDKVREKKLFSDITDLIGTVGADASGNSLKGLETLKRLTVALTAMHTIDSACDVRNRLNELRDEYMKMKSGATGLKGRPYPWPALNEATLGLQNQQLVFLYGRPKTFKTWLLLAIAKTLFLTGCRLLIFSQEISDIEMCRRFVAHVTGVDYNQYMRGCLPAQEEHDFLENLDMFVECESVIVDRLANGKECLTELKAKISEYRPHVVLIDGINYLSTDWKELAEILRGMKREAQDSDIPIVGTTHANRSRGKSGEATDAADDFAYGDAFYQVADLAIRAVCEIEDRKQRQVQLFTAAVREGQSTLFTVNTFLAQDLSQKAIIKIGDAENDIDGEIDQDKLDGEEDGRSDEEEETGT